MTHEATSQTVTTEVFAGAGPQEVDVTRAAPFGWWAAIVVALVAFIDRVEVNLIAGALPAIQEHFDFGDTMAGAIPTATTLAGAILLLPAGRLADSGRRTSIIAMVVLVWSACSVLSGLATTFALFFATRVLLGAAGQLYNPPASSLLADYYPARSRAKAYGFERAGYYMGLPVGVALGGALAEGLGWRGVFFVVAAPGLLVAALVLTLREPIRGIGDRLSRLAGDEVSDDEHGIVGSAGAARGSLLHDALSLLQIRTLRGVVTGLALLYVGLGGLFYWLPTLLERTADLDYDAAAGLAGGVGGTGIVIGIILGSRFGDRGHGVRPGHRIRLSWSFLLLGALALTAVVTVPWLPLRLVAIALACVGFAGAIPNLTAASADVVPAHRRGMGFALLQFLLTLGGALGPLVIGVTSDLVGNLAWAMLALLPPLFACLMVLRSAADGYEDDAARAQGTQV